MPDDQQRGCIASSPPGISTSGPATATSTTQSIDNREAFIFQLGGGPDRRFRAPFGRPCVLGIHHLKFAVSNLDVSIAWYERVLGAVRLPELDHYRADGSRSAAICGFSEWAGLCVELRQTEQAALLQRNWDPITLTVPGHDDLLHWISWLDRWATLHSPILVGLRGWVLIFEDPDGRRIRLYTQQSHRGGITPTRDPMWINED